MIPKPTRPIIVCGMARSGTTVLGAMVRRCGDVIVFPELSPHSTAALFDLLEQVRATLASQTWREFEPADIDARVLELLRRIWAAGRDEGDDDTGQERFGLKQPHAEDVHEAFARVLGDYRPLWVYALREPAAVYDSTLRMARWGDVEPEVWAERCAASFAAADTLRRRGELIVFDVARASLDPVYREERAFAVKDFLGFVKPRGLRPFLSGWPSINVSRGRNAGPLADAEIARRVRRLSSQRFRSLSDAFGSLKSH